MTGAPASRERSTGFSPELSSPPTRSSPWAATGTWPASPGTWASSSRSCAPTRSRGHRWPKGPGFIILGDHFSPVTALLAPLYRLFPSPVTLLVAQAALFALSAVPVTRAAARLLGRRGGLALGLAYGLSWGIQRAVDFDFHEICFAVPLIAFSLEALLARRPRAALWWALPLVLVKEDLGLTLAAIALVIAWRSRGSSPRTVRYALGVAVFGVAAAVLVLTVIIPSFNTAGGYDYWTKVSDAGSPFDGLATKLRTLAWLLVPTTGLLALRSPLVLVALPTLGGGSSPATSTTGAPTGTTARS
ncbi:DUF2079 domain-containing protein [Streptomyces massasporeus]|uniref:DUF2079 domain-containing protein n=1 Tax=Streptomyces massasporeus TaxID=67324 RepID=UPI00371505F7